MNAKEWEDNMLARPEASSISGEHDEHVEGDEGYTPSVRPDGKEYCRCSRCTIIRIKRRRAFKFSRSKCPSCGELHLGIYRLCPKCMKQ